MLSAVRLHRLFEGPGCQTPGPSLYHFRCISSGVSRQVYLVGVPSCSPGTPASPDTPAPPDGSYPCVSVQVDLRPKRAHKLSDASYGGLVDCVDRCVHPPVGGVAHIAQHLVVQQGVFERGIVEHQEEEYSDHPTNEWEDDEHP